MCTPTVFFFIFMDKTEWVPRKCKQKYKIHKIMLNTARKKNTALGIN